jgi:hypothetical protein
MKVDTDPLLMAETNYAEPLEINMIEVAENKVQTNLEFEEDGGFVLVKNKKEITNNLPKVLEAKLLKEAVQATEGQGIVDKNLTEATEGLRMKFEKVRISDDQMLGVNMVDFEQPHAEMQEVERCLEKEREQRRESLPKKDASLRKYLFHRHKKNQDKLLCPRCSIICNPRIAAEFERAQRERTGVNWRQDNQLYRVYPRADESLLEFIVRCHKIGTECLRHSKKSCSLLVGGAKVESLRTTLMLAEPCREGQTVPILGERRKYLSNYLQRFLLIGGCK